MAEGPPEDSAPGNWWDSWYQVAKDKSTAALELVKKDLSEFTCTVRSDTSNAVASTSDTLHNTIQPDRTAPAMSYVKSGISTILDGITRALTIPPDDGPVDELRITTGGDVSYDRGQARLSAIQLDPGTYCSPPSGPPEQYEMWRDNFDLECKKGEISEMLVSRVEVRALYTKLVPAEVSHADFWARYFYKVHQLQLDEARKVALMRRAEDSRDDSFTWDDEEDDGSDDDEKNGFIDLTPQKTLTQQRQQHERLSKTEDTQAESDHVEVNTEGDKSVEDLSKIDTTPDSVQITNDKTVNKTEDISGGVKTVSDTVNDVNNENVKQTDNESAGQINTSPSPEKDLNVVKSEPQVNTISADDNVKETTTTTTSDLLIPLDVAKTKTEPVMVPSEDEADRLSGEAGIKADSKLLTELKTREKGDMVVVGSGSSSPVSDESANIKKESGSAEATDDDWDEDFDIELTEEDIRLAEEAAKKYKSPETLEDLDMMEDDWNWG